MLNRFLCLIKKCVINKWRQLYLFLLLTCVIIRLNAQQKDSFIENTGDVLMIGLPAISLIGTLVQKDYQGTWEFSKGYILNRVITLSMKEIIDKKRPDLTDERAFPSGHTSNAFQGASFIQRRYGWKFGIPAYALAGVVGYSRIQADRHDGWDVLGGIIVGVGSTYLFTKPYKKEQLELSFSKDKNSTLVGFRYKF